MNISEQVCSMEQAMILKQLGIQQEQSTWYWEKLNPLPGCATQRLQIHFNSGHAMSKSVVIETFAAFTVSEIAKMMRMDHAGCLMPSLSHYHKWMDYHHIKYTSMATLHAALLIELIQNNVFPVSEINARFLDVRITSK